MKKDFSIQNIKPYLDKDEQVIWGEKREKAKRNIRFDIRKKLFFLGLAMLMSGILIMGLVVFTASYMFLYLVIFPIIFIILNAIKDLEIGENIWRYNKDTYYIATNKRLWVIEGKSRKAVSYKRIRYTSTPIHKAIKFYYLKKNIIGTEEEHTLLEFTNLSDVNQALNTISRTWHEKGPFTSLNKVFQDFANSHHLKYLPNLWAAQAPFLILTGEINGKKVEMRITSKGKTYHLSIKMDCPNPNEHYVEIKQETVLTKAQEDLQVGNKDFDDVFFIKTDEEAFSQSLLNSKNQVLLMKLQKMKFGKITFGNAKGRPLFVRKKRKFKDYNQVLDFHLLEGEKVSPRTKIIAPDENRATTLSYEVTFNPPYETTPSFLAQYSDLAFKSSLALVQSITDYSGK